MRPLKFSLVPLTCCCLILPSNVQSGPAAPQPAAPQPAAAKGLRNPTPVRLTHEERLKLVVRKKGLAPAMDAFSDRVFGGGVTVEPGSQLKHCVSTNGTPITATLEATVGLRNVNLQDTNFIFRFAIQGEPTVRVTPPEHECHDVLNRRAEAAKDKFRKEVEEPIQLSAGEVKSRGGFALRGLRAAFVVPLDKSVTFLSKEKTLHFDVKLGIIP